jgi:hypothetical protein
MPSAYTYKDTYDASLRVNWKISDIIGGEKRLDFSKRFLPEGLARVEELAFLSEDEKRILNQIRGHEYLSMFGLVEEFILPFVLDHARTHVGDEHQTTALINFAGEEMKHMQLFRRFQNQFEKGFGVRCRMVGPPDVLGAAVLAHHPLAVSLIVLHVEWMTQRHYLESTRADPSLDPLFKSLLKHHWMEEAQHAKLDTLMLESLASSCDDETRARVFDEYLHILAILDEGLVRQAEFNLEAFMIAAQRMLSDEERAEFLTRQVRAIRATYLGAGLTHPHLLGTLEMLSPALRVRAEEIAPRYC